MGVTIKDVAAKSGLSLATVSRVLNDQNDHFREETRHQVMKAVRDLGYRRNSGARAMRHGRFGSLTIVFSALGGGRSSMSEGMIRGATQALDDRGMHLSVAYLTDEQLTDKRFMPRFLREWMSDGLLINYNKLLPPHMSELIEEYRLPCIWMNDKREHDCVYPDDLGAGRRATEHLLQLGHRDVAYVSYSAIGPESHFSEFDRRDGYVQAMRSAGLAPRVVGRFEDRVEMEESRMEAAAALLAGEDRPTGLVVYGLSSMMPVVRAADQVGILVPDELSLIGFEPKPVYVGLQLTSMMIPDEQLGRTGVEVLMDRIAPPPHHEKPRVVPFGFERGQTTAPPAASAGR